MSNLNGVNLYTMLLIGAVIFFAFLLGLVQISASDNQQKMKQEIECIQAGGQAQTFPHACVKS